MGDKIGADAAYEAAAEAADWIEAIVFDVDGVLVDSLKPHLDYCKTVADELGVEVNVPTPDAFKRDIARSPEEISPMIKFFEAIKFDPEKAKAGAERYGREFGDVKQPLFPGVPDMLRNLSSEGVPLAIATSNVRAVVTRSLGDCAPLFKDKLTITDDDPHGGDKANALRAIAAELGIATTGLLFVGDQSKDRKAAEEVGAVFLGVSYGWEIEIGDSCEIAGSAAEVGKLVREKIRASAKRMSASAEAFADHARAMHVYHAGQRHASIRFYFVALTVIVAGFGGLLTAGADAPAVNRMVFGATLAVVGILVSAFFWLLDHRNDLLVRCDEEALKVAERRLALVARTPTVNSIRSSDTVQPDWIRYGTLMPCLFLGFVLLSVLGAVYSLSIGNPAFGGELGRALFALVFVALVIVTRQSIRLNGTPVAELAKRE